MSDFADIWICYSGFML